MFSIQVPLHQKIAVPLSVLTPFSSSVRIEQILIRTREAVTIVAPQLEIPLSLARMQPDYIRTVGIMSSRPTNCRDHTIHAAISPYIPNTYALVGDQGRVAIWTRRSSDSNTSRHAQKSTDAVAIIRKHDNALNDQEDPWRSCIWSAHPSNLIVTSRTHMELVDYRVRSPCTDPTCSAMVVIESAETNLGMPLISNRVRLQQRRYLNCGKARRSRLFKRTMCPHLHHSIHTSPPLTKLHASTSDSLNDHLFQHPIRWVALCLLD